MAANDNADHLRRIMAQHGRTSFNFATRYLPHELRQPVVELYAFFRTLDDLVDEHPNSPEHAELLDEWRAWASSPNMRAPDPEIAVGVDRAMRDFGVPRQIISDFLAGLASDFPPRAVADDQEFSAYCYQVASTVGIAMAHVLGATSPGALRAASDLGAAMQRTNILRDIGEDLDAERVYLPSTLLAQYGLSTGELQSMRRSGKDVSPAARALVHSQIEANRNQYREALPGILLLPHDVRFPILLASRLYRHLLAVIESNGYDSITHAASTSNWDKAREFLLCQALVRLWGSSGSNAGNA